MEKTEEKWREPTEGFEFDEDTVVVTEEHQTEKLLACGLDSSVFGEFVDASFYIGIAIHAGIENGISAEGNVNMLQKLEQHRRVKLGESLTVKGTIRKITEVPRGITIDTDVWFDDEEGNRAFTVTRRSLKPDPAKTSRRGAGDRPPPVVEDVSLLEAFDAYQLTAEMVKSYSMDGNSIHYEMDAANKAGFRAPLIGGGMGVHYLLATIWEHCTPTEFDLDIFFRRPIFWDDHFRVYASIDESWESICLGRQGKVLTEARINRLVKAI